MKALDLACVLSRFRFSFSTEAELQLGIEQVLRAAKITFEREKILSPADRPDFVVGRVAIEVKIAGCAANLLRQCARYLQFEQLDELLIVAGSHKLAAQMPHELCGKPLHTLNVRSTL